MFKLNNKNFFTLSTLKVAALEYIVPHQKEEYMICMNDLALEEINDFLPDDVRAWEDYDFQMKGCQYKNINSGKVLTEEEYYQLLRKEARELGTSVLKLYASDDDFEMVDADGNPLNIF